MKRILILCVSFLLVITLSSVTINIPGDYSSIQEGIEASSDGDTVLVESGTYVENIDFLGKAITVASLYYTTQDTSYISQTIIDGNQNGSVINFSSDEDSTSFLSGFFITNGLAENGGGIYCNNASPIVENLIITENAVDGGSHNMGGGIFCCNSSAIFRNLEVSDNISYGDIFGMGGGIYCNATSNLFDEVIIKNNCVTGDGQTFGGGIYISSSSTLFIGGTIENNSITNGAHCYGGGIYITESEINLDRLLIKNNSVADGSHCSGAGIFCNYSNSILSFVTLTGNTANNGINNHGGTIYCSELSEIFIFNCILYNNTPEEVYCDPYSEANTISFSHNDVSGGINDIVLNGSIVNWLDGNVDVDPLFVDPENGDYRLQEYSPCIDTGIDYFEFDGEVYLDLEPDEYFGSAPDMGYWEYGATGNTDNDVNNTIINLNVFPNPFNPRTAITFSLQQMEYVNLSIYNLRGQKVEELIDGKMTKGEHKVIWDAEDKASGIYYLRFKTDSFEQISKLVLLK